MASTTSLRRPSEKLGTHSTISAIQRLPEGDEGPSSLKPFSDGPPRSKRLTESKSTWPVICGGRKGERAAPHRERTDSPPPVGVHEVRGLGGGPPGDDAGRNRSGGLDSRAPCDAVREAVDPRGAGAGTYGPCPGRPPEEKGVRSHGHGTARG